MAGVGAPVIFVFQKIRSSSWFNRVAAMRPHNERIAKSTSLPVVLAHNRSDLDSNGIRGVPQLVNGSSSLARVRPWLHG